MATSIPYLRCPAPACGLYHDLRQKQCTCGEPLCAAHMVILESSPPIEEYGIVGEDLEYYVQICPACGGMNFTPDAGERVTRCIHCGKGRVSIVEPVLPKGEGCACAAEVSADETDDGAAQAAPQPRRAAAEDSGNGSASSRSAPECAPDMFDGWYDQLAGVLDGVVGGVPETTSTPEKASCRTQGKAALQLRFLHQFAGEQIAVTIQQAHAVIGREAQGDDFLFRDERVGRRHCSVFFEDGAWSIRDEHSTNGTALNGEELQPGRRYPIRAGDIVRLGNCSDSAMFEVGFSV